MKKNKIILFLGIMSMFIFCNQEKTNLDNFRNIERESYCKILKINGKLRVKGDIIYELNKYGNDLKMDNPIYLKDSTFIFKNEILFDLSSKKRVGLLKHYYTTEYSTEDLEGNELGDFIDTIKVERKVIPSNLLNFSKKEYKLFKLNKMFMFDDYFYDLYFIVSLKNGIIGEFLSEKSKTKDVLILQYKGVGLDTILSKKQLENIKLGKLL